MQRPNWVGPLQRMRPFVVQDVLLVYGGGIVLVIGVGAGGMDVVATDDEDVVVVVLMDDGTGVEIVDAEVTVELCELVALPVLLPVAVAWLMAAQPLPVGGAKACLSKVVTYLPGLGISRLLLS